MQGAGCCYSAALAPAPPSLSPARLSLSPGKLRTRRNTPPLSPPCRAPRRQSARCRVSGETWLPCVAASVPLWTVRAFGRPPVFCRCRPGVVSCLDREEKNGEGLHPNSAFALVWLWLHSTGYFWRDLWLCKNRYGFVVT
ncbi:uncharacterized protein LOC108302951 isoform X5 [Cebus imitator]|uniref:uncharacterized protein LOC108302951 isoform X5 n=1 Tax=Cebus imitator TaxID=2715852 RepID=UPI00189A2B1B|nr:uncharacterized protein LOC108302951 isoform X5 [Cebus imitator]